MPIADRLRARLVQALLPAVEARVRALLRPQLAAVAVAREEARLLGQHLSEVEQHADQLRARLDTGPFHAGMTVHAAHARHAGVAAVFARHGLPACPACAVGADEVLSEAARGEGLPLAELLAELNLLLS